MRRKYLWAGLMLATLGAVSAIAEPKKANDSKKVVESSQEADSRKASSKDVNSSKDNSSKESDKKNESPSKRPGKGKTKNVTGFTKEREAAALTFVRTHHAELAELLEQLKAANVAEYQRAIRDLFLSSEHLAQIEERNPQKYELELQNWTLNSRIQVLVARLSMQPSKTLEEELRQVLAEKVEAREQLLLYEYQKAQAKLAEANTQLEEFRQDRPKLVDQWLQDLLEQARDPGATSAKK